MILDPNVVKLNKGKQMQNPIFERNVITKTFAPFPGLTGAAATGQKAIAEHLTGIMNVLNEGKVSEAYLDLVGAALFEAYGIATLGVVQGWNGGKTY